MFKWALGVLGGGFGMVVLSLVVGQWGMCGPNEGGLMLFVMGLGGMGVGVIWFLVAVVVALNDWRVGGRVLEGKREGE